MKDKQVEQQQIGTMDQMAVAGVQEHGNRGYGRLEEPTHGRGQLVAIWIATWEDGIADGNRADG